MGSVQPDLLPSDVRRIATAAGDIDPRTVDRYLTGGRVQPDNARDIEEALRTLKLDAHIRRPGLAKSR